MHDVYRSWSFRWRFSSGEAGLRVAEVPGGRQSTRWFSASLVLYLEAYAALRSVLCMLNQGVMGCIIRGVEPMWHRTLSKCLHGFSRSSNRTSRRSVCTPIYAVGVKELA